MKTLGLSYGFHDSSAALVIDGKLHSVYSEERFTRQKHDSFFPQFSIEACLKSSGLQLKDLDRVVFYEKTPKKFSRVLRSVLSDWPQGHQEFNEAIKAWLGKKLWTENQIVQRLQIAPDKVISMSHHEAHAYQAFLGSGFEDAAILTVDAVGEWSTTGLWEARWQEGKPCLQSIEESQYPHSLGLFYSAMTAFLGFKPMNDECSTMALAAFGKPRYIDFFRRILKIENGKVWLDPLYFQFDLFFKSPFQEKLLLELGEPVKDFKYSFSSFEAVRVSADEQRCADIASSVQLIFEECVLKLAEVLKSKTKSQNLCLAGGGALNCVANSKLLKNSGFQNVFIPVDPGDGGAAMGAAFFGHFLNETSTPDESSYRPSLGRMTRANNDFADVVREIEIKKLKKFAKVSQKDVLEWEVTEFQTEEELTDRVAHELWNYQIIGWFQGDSEYGPRALGHRSILIRADHGDLALRLSQKVKERALFRPYALSMTEELAPAVLNATSSELRQKPMEWMQLAISVNPEFHRKVRSGLHIDGTTRPQFVRKKNSPLFHKLLHKYARHSGIACVVNTSFNESGYPIVQNPMEALLMFARTDMDILVINQTLIRKVRSYDTR